MALGFPKSMNIGLEIDKRNGVDSPVVDMGKSGVSSRAYQSEETTTAGKYEIREAQNKWKGWGTQLKPSYEPIIVARKPVETSIIDNVIKYGVGGINVDECRVGNETRTIPINAESIDIKENGTMMDTLHKNQQHERVATNQGRFPANTILTYDENDYDEVCGNFPNTKVGKITGNENFTETNNIYGKYKPINTQRGFGDSGSASRYFYCAKASKKDRDEGLEEFEEKNTMCDRNPELASANMPQNRSGNLRKNIHPTVKPTELMQYLIRLVTPKGGVILDPFMGSGSTGKAAMYENIEKDANYKFIGIEQDKEYCEIANARISAANGDYVVKEYDEDGNITESKYHIPKQTKLF